jgi:type I restriction enzyme S subunit
VTVGTPPQPPPEWEPVTLGQIVDEGGGVIQTGPFGSQLHASDYVEDGIPSIMPVNLGDNRIVTDGIARVTEKDAGRLSRYRVRPGDIIYSRRGDVERRALVRSREDGWLCGTGCLMVRLGPTSSVDPAFASQYLGLPEVRRWIVRHAVGATMPNLNTSIMRAVPFVIPPMDTQRRIASILETVEAKIQLCSDTADTLEAICGAVFKSWFVNYDPVRARSGGQREYFGMADEVYSTFPDRFVLSEGTPVPAGWSRRRLGDICTFEYGKALKASDRRDGPVPVYGSAGVVGRHDKPLAAGPGIVVGRKGRPGTVRWAQEDFFPIDTSFYVLPKTSGVDLTVLRYLLHFANLERYAADSAVPGLSRSIAYGIPVIVPGARESAAFSEFHQRVQALISSNAVEAKKLELLRDNLRLALFPPTSTQVGALPLL